MELGVDAVGHVAGEKEVGVVDFEGVAEGRDGGGLLDEFGDGEGGVRGVVIPGFQALAEKPHAVDVFMEAEGVVDAAEVGEVFGAG